jgi:NADH-quinone oxidoreductase subunit J
VFLKQLSFWVFAGLAGLTSIFVVTTRNIVHAALGLAAALGAAAAIFILFGAEFVGLAQILIYVGAVVILFLFGIMLTSQSTGRPVVDNKQRGVAALVALGVFAVLAVGIVGAFGDERLSFDVAFPVRELGQDLFTTWVLPFEAVSILLLAALVGAIVLARRD